MAKRKAAPTVQALVDALTVMPLRERIQTIWGDVQSKKDRYRKIPAHTLAELLDVPGPEKPDGHWSFIQFAEEESHRRLHRADGFTGGGLRLSGGQSG